jgi:hypothetical protein
MNIRKQNQEKQIQYFFGKLTLAALSYWQKQHTEIFALKN